MGFTRDLDEDAGYELLEMVLERAGYNRDVKVPEELFGKNRERLVRSERTYVDRIYPGARVYRDERPYTSLHVTDFRECEGKDGIGAHVERFNPEYHPFLHSVDVLLWHLKSKLGRWQEPLIEADA